MIRSRRNFLKLTCCGLAAAAGQAIPAKRTAPKKAAEPFRWLSLPGTALKEYVDTWSLPPVKLKSVTAGGPDATGAYRTAYTFTVKNTDEAGLADYEYPCWQDYANEP